MQEIFEVPNRTESVIRWQGVQLIGKRKNISEHCFQTAIYCLVLYHDLSLEEFGIDKGNLLHLAITHDVPEIITGDLPVSVKQRRPEIKTILDSLEEEILNQELEQIGFTAAAQNEKFIVKVCDYICVRLELFQELELGNSSAPIQKAVEVVNKIYHKIFFEKFNQGIMDEELWEKVTQYLRINFNSSEIKSLNQ